jgi:hypothetical protein
MVVQQREILLNDIRQLGDLDGSVIEQRFPFGHCSRVRHPSIGSNRADSHSASLCSFAVVAVIPRPISAAFLANSDLLPFGAPASADPFASRRCESDSSACRCAPTLVEAMRFWAWPRIALNSPVRSWMDGPVMFAGSRVREVERTVSESCAEDAIIVGARNQGIRALSECFVYRYGG